MDEDEKRKLRNNPLMTTRGYSQRRTVLRTRMERVFKVIQKQMTLIDTLLLSEEIEMVNKENDTLQRLHQEVTNANNEWLSCSKNEDQTESEVEEDSAHASWMDIVDTSLFEHKQKVCEWIVNKNKSESNSNSKRTKSSQSAASKTSKCVDEKLPLTELNVNTPQTETRLHLESQNITTPSCGRNKLQAQMQRTFAAMGKQSIVIEKLLECNNIDIINNESSAFDKLYQEIMDKNAEFLSYFVNENPSPKEYEENKVQSLWMDAVDAFYFEIKQKICNQVIEMEKTKSSKKSHLKRGSSTSTSTKSSKTKIQKTSHHSDTSSISSASRKSTEQKAKVAGLKAEADFIKKTREAEMNAELVNIQRKIAKAEAKEKVYAEEDRTVSRNIEDKNVPSSSNNKSSLHETVSQMLKVQSAPSVQSRI